MSRIETGKLGLDFATAVILTKQLDISLDLLASTANNLPAELLEQERKLIQARKDIKDLQNKTQEIRKNSVPIKK